MEMMMKNKKEKKLLAEPWNVEVLAFRLDITRY